MTEPTKQIPTADRKVFHALVDMGMRAARSRGVPVDVDEMLDSVGLFSWAPHREQAKEYAKTLLGAGGAK